MPFCVLCVTKEHCMFVKRDLTYLVVSTIWGRGEQDSGVEAVRGGYRGSDQARVGLN